MAVIQFTPADALQTTLVEAGVYPSKISKIEGPKASSSGKSNNYFVNIQITDGKYKGKERTIVMNSETNSPSLLGEMQFYPDSFFLTLEAAIKNKKVEAIAQALDTDTLIDQPFDAQWAVATVEGRLINTIVAFYPAGYAAKAPAF